MELSGESIMDGGLSGAAARPQDTAWSEPAFESVYFEYYPRVFAVLYRMLGDRAQAEELASDTFVRLSQQRPSGVNNLGGWLYRTATRLGIDSLRMSQRRKHYEQQAAEYIGEAPRTPLQDVLRDETCRRVRGVLARLKPVQAQILMLRSNGLSYRELSTTLGIRLTSVGRVLVRAESAFEKAWQKFNVGHTSFVSIGE